VLLKELARGGMGRVFMAITGGRVCAVKTLHDEDAGAHLAARFRDEAQLATSLSHPNLVYVSEAGTVGGAQYLAMEYVRGKTLHDVLRRSAELGRAIPIGLALFITRELLRALAYMHGVAGLRLVHRDVAPSNVMLSYEGGVKVIDLGLAKWRDRAGQTTLGDQLGQPRYTSPEQRRGEPVDARSDLFSVGVILWEMLTGRPLFRDGSARRDSDEPPSPSSVVPQLPRALDAIVMPALARDPQDRYQSAQEAIAIITPHLSPEHEGGALQELLAQLFQADIQVEEAEERALVAAATPLLAAEMPAEEAGARAPGRAWASRSESTQPLTRPGVKRRRRASAVLAVAALIMFAIIGWRAVSSREEAPRPMAGAGAQPTAVVTSPRPPVAATPPEPVRQLKEPSAPPPSAAAVVRQEGPGHERIGSPKGPARPSAPPRETSAQILEKAEDLYRSQSFAAAIALGKRAIRMPGGELEGHLLLGKIHIQMEFFRDALDHYEAALRIAPGDRDALRGRALARAGLARGTDP
jgi:serine/threonine-protein kinase